MSTPIEWLEKRLQLDGPRELAEIVITQYEGGTMGYQFTGLDGRPMNPLEVHQMLTLIRNEVERVIQPVPQLLPPEPTPQLEGVPA